MSRTAVIQVRVKPAGLAAIDTLAAAEGVTRSAMIRTLIGEALAARERNARRTA